MTDPLSILEPQSPSRRRRVVGEIFAMRTARGYLFGRVVNTDARWALGEGGNHANLIYIFQDLHPTPEVPSSEYLKPDHLLLPPILTNSRPWSMGYFLTVGKTTLAPGDILSTHCFRDVRNGRLYSENGDELSEPVGPVGDFALDSFKTIDEAIAAKLATTT